MKITQCSVNAYAGAEVVQPEEMLAKAQRVDSIFPARKLTQCEATEIIGGAQRRLSNILRGQFRGVSEVKLMDCLLLLDSRCNWCGKRVVEYLEIQTRQSTQGAVSI